MKNQTKTQSSTFNIEHWIKIFKEDPKAFEKQKREYIINHIKTITNGNKEREWKLLGYFYFIERDLKNYKDPIARYNKMIEIFYRELSKNSKEMMELCDGSDRNN
jgi:hypothetical protein